MKTLITICLILAAGTIIGLAVNCKSLVPVGLVQKEGAGACSQEMIKGDPFEIFGIPKIDIEN